MILTFLNSLYIYKVYLKVIQVVTTLIDMHFAWFIYFMVLRIVNEPSVVKNTMIMFNRPLESGFTLELK